MPESLTNNRLTTDPSITDADLVAAVRGLARFYPMDHIFFEAATISAIRIASEDKAKRMEAITNEVR